MSKSNTFHIKSNKHLIEVFKVLYKIQIPSLLAYIKICAKINVLFITVFLKY